MASSFAPLCALACGCAGRNTEAAVAGGQFTFGPVTGRDAEGGRQYAVAATAAPPG